MSYTITHLHSTRSNSVLLDSTSSPEEYIKFLKDSPDIENIIFTEHGNCIGWVEKYLLLKKLGKKYIHAAELYLAEDKDSDITYHICVFAKNHKGFKELNELISISYNDEGHFYKRPRIFLDDLLKCENIIISTACIGGLLNNIPLLDKIRENFKGEIFLEIQPHSHPKQIEFNNLAIEYSNKYKIPLIAANDVHNINSEYALSRKLLQEQSKINYDEDENAFDLTIKSFDNFVVDFDKIGIGKGVSLIALENTNLLISLCEEYDIDTNYKYPKLYDDSEKELWRRIKDNCGELSQEEDIRVKMEFDAMKEVGAIDYMLLVSDLVNSVKSTGKLVGAGRGSVAGSQIAYRIGITDIDAIKYGTVFSRFINKYRKVSPDIDIDMYKDTRKIAYQWLDEHKTLKSSKIITYSNFQELSAIEAIARIEGVDGKKYKNVDDRFKAINKTFYDKVESLMGGMRAIGVHASGQLVSDLNLREEIGLISIVDKDTKVRVPVSQIDMIEIEKLGFIKIDILGLDALGVIEKTFEYAKVNVSTRELNFNDDKVWSHLISSPVLCFQYEEANSMNKLKKAIINITDIDKLQIMSNMNGLMRPSGVSIVDKYINGIKFDWGIKEINDLFSKNLGYVSYQEDIMKFTNMFCGFSEAESDNIRRAISKKIEEDVLEQVKLIRIGFYKNFKSNNNYTEEQLSFAIETFLKIATDASSYSFNYSHAIAYSTIGYLCAYLRYYYPIEFLTAALNIHSNNLEKVQSILSYIKSNTGINFEIAKFGFSKGEYSYDKDTNSIFEGANGFKSLSQKGIDNLPLKHYDDIRDFFIENILSENPIGQADLKILAQVDYFRGFGCIGGILKYIDILYDDIKLKKGQTEKTELVKIAKAKEIIVDISLDIPIYDKVLFELNIKNFTNIDLKLRDNIIFVSSSVLKYGKYKCSVFNLKEMKSEEWIFDTNPPKSVLLKAYPEVKPKMTLVGDTWQKKVGEFKIVCKGYETWIG